MKPWREPLLQIIVLGAILFSVYFFGGKLISPNKSQRIEITGSEISFLVDRFERQWQRPPSNDELTALIDNRVREEVMYREALAMGLDRNDAIVRRRMMQKMDLLSQDLALLSDPTDAELQTFLGENPEKYQVPPRASFHHVYFNADKRGESVADEARRDLAELRSRSPVPERAPNHGDPFLFSYDFTDATPFEVSRVFGQVFADSLFVLDPGWHGPLVSGYGLHLVHVLERIDGRAPAVSEVREALVRDYNRERLERFRESLFEKLAERYEIKIDEEARLRFTEEARASGSAHPP